jgi:hypothetical protein
MVKSLEVCKALFKRCVDIPTPKVTAACLLTAGIIALTVLVGLSAPVRLGVNSSRTLTPPSRETSKLRPEGALFLPKKSCLQKVN